MCLTWTGNTGDVEIDIAGTDADLLRVDATRDFFAINSGDIEVIEAERFNV